MNERRRSPDVRRFLTKEKPPTLRDRFRSLGTIDILTVKTLNESIKLVTYIFAQIKKL